MQEKRIIQEERQQSTKKKQPCNARKRVIQREKQQSTKKKNNFISTMNYNLQNYE